MSPDVCRACLDADHGDADDVRRVHIIDDQLLVLYQKLAGVCKLSADGKCTLCYICYSQLWRCLKFSEMVQKSEKYLKSLSKAKVSMKILNLEKKQTLVVETLKPISVGGIKEAEERGNNKSPKTKYSRKYIKKMNKSDTEISNSKTSEESDCDSSSVTNAVQHEDILIVDKDEDIQEYVTIAVDGYVGNDDINSNEEYDNNEDNIIIEENVNNKQMNRNVDDNENNKTSKKENIDEEIETIIVEEYLDEDFIAEESSLLNMNIQVKKKRRKDAYKETPRKPHVRPRNLMCEICGSTSYSRGHFEQHMRVHTGEKFYCKICNKGFTQEGSLERHMKLHSGLRPHCCHICGKTFNEKHILRKHVLVVHKGYRPYSCEVCDKKCSTKHMLQCHMECHTGPQIENICSLCNAQLASKLSLRNHKKFFCRKNPGRIKQKPRKKKAISKNVEI